MEKCLTLNHFIERHGDTLIFFDKKKMVSDFNMSCQTEFDLPSLFQQNCGNKLRNAHFEFY